MHELYIARIWMSSLLALVTGNANDHPETRHHDPPEDLTTKCGFGTNRGLTTIFLDLL